MMVGVTPDTAGSVRKSGDDDQHHLGEFIDAEGDEENRQQREGHNLIEEQHEPQEKDPHVREQTHVKAQQHGWDQQNHAIEEPA
jgi:hypothetical protein